MKLLIGSLSVLAASGCASHVWNGTDISSGVAIEARASEMPAGHTFSGSYQSTEMGKPLQLEVEGESVRGRYRRPRPPDNDCTITGTLAGIAKANLLEFTWEEDYSACGEGRVHGKGWALYRIQEGDARARLYGKRGLFGSDRDQGPWQAIKMTETSTR